MATWDSVVSFSKRFHYLKLTCSATTPTMFKSLISSASVVKYIFSQRLLVFFLILCRCLIPIKKPKLKTHENGRGWLGWVKRFFIRCYFRCEGTWRLERFKPFTAYWKAIDSDMKKVSCFNYIHSYWSIVTIGMLWTKQAGFFSSIIIIR